MTWSVMGNHKGAKRDQDVEEVLGRRRQHGRVKINFEFASLEEFISEYVKDISASGIFIRSEHPLSVGTKVDLRFTVIADEIETVEGVGVVVRTVPRSPGVQPGMGVRFEELPPHSAAVVARLTAHLPPR